MCPSSAAEIWSKAAAHADPRTGRNRAYSTLNYATFRYFQKHDEWWAIDTQKGKIFNDEPGWSRRLERSDVCGGDVTAGWGVFTLERPRVWPWNKRRKWFGQGRVETIDWAKKKHFFKQTLLIALADVLNWMDGQLLYLDAPKRVYL